MIEFFNVGKIVNTQGLKGEVRVISSTDFPEERYQKGKVLTLFQEKKAPIELTIKTHRKHKNFDILSFENHPSINDVEKYRDGILRIAKEDLTELATNEFYYHEIIGLTVEDESGQAIGKVKEILSPGANDVWVVQRPKKKDALIPYIESVVKEIDLAAGKVLVEIPEGLLDDED
ncbi:16S rRNA processing protein RimM [Enterococcus sp. PF1-24]|uniref:ribosome maturation factor RimM n=1 Tax=unclassified Enterococcus TaxID=2608891 RepID=UPI0024747767|nr:MULTISPECIES: ribosome maturation factor RimM [unclassified Enterococcus]MDH6365758.1 16S rRNA processing protein RimM [Enterococcus sp. PFB1-1]MDH6402859.1 16S rRNA processing protein RimM [Enterococcus sp. PF1-24]